MIQLFPVFYYGRQAKIGDLEMSIVGYQQILNSRKPISRGRSASVESDNRIRGYRLQV